MNTKKLNEHQADTQTKENTTRHIIFKFLKSKEEKILNAGGETQLV